MHSFSLLSNFIQSFDSDFSFLNLTIQKELCFTTRTFSYFLGIVNSLVVFIFLVFILFSYNCNVILCF